MKCKACGLKVQRVIKAGDFVQRTDGVVGLVKATWDENKYLSVLLVGAGITMIWKGSDVDLIHGVFHITERITP